MLVNVVRYAIQLHVTVLVHSLYAKWSFPPISSDFNLQLLYFFNNFLSSSLAISLGNWSQLRVNVLANYVCFFSSLQPQSNAYFILYYLIISSSSNLIYPYVLLLMGPYGKRSPISFPFLLHPRQRKIFLFKDADTKYFRLCGLHGLFCNYTASLVWNQMQVVLLSRRRALLLDQRTQL